MIIKGVYDSAKILIWKQITTQTLLLFPFVWCIWLCKDTNLKANHNMGMGRNPSKRGVYDSAKILIWKQITTILMNTLINIRCIWLCKDTNLKANHNTVKFFTIIILGVYDSAKILIWKQITTRWGTNHWCYWCIWLCKDTNLKANHNRTITSTFCDVGVYDSAKILIWKQITTVHLSFRSWFWVYMTLQRY